MDGKFQTPPSFKPKARDISTADMLVSHGRVAEGAEELMLQNQTLRECLAIFGVTSEEQVSKLIAADRISKSRSSW
jgi:hypothetical protein